VFAYRLARAGIDPKKVARVSGPVDASGSPRDFAISDLAMLDDFIAAEGDIRLLIIDPWNHLLDGDENRRDDNLAALAPLIGLAERRRVSLVIVAHVSKRQEGSAKDKVSGHKILTNKCRSILYVSTLEDGSVAVAHAKHNWSRAATTLTFQITEDGFAWTGTTTAGADELARPRETSKVTLAQAWLREILGGGPVASKDLDDLAEEQGIRTRTLERARKDIAEHYRGDDGHFFWRLR
jgi:hypothetical protein